MATYPRLLLTTGGGIISRTQQADQVKNTASIIIGLGGTGIDCIKEVKKSVYERLKPDDSNAIYPSYSHIQFIAVDTDNQYLDSNRTDGSLDETECFNIGNSAVKAMISNKAAVGMRKELNWLSEGINTLNMGDAGAGGLRQAGRFMLMDKSGDFMDKVKLAINTAKKDLINPQINIHIFAGISGGTGSGTFLDACYLVKKATEGTNANIFGYFFLPDVNLDPDKIPMGLKLVRTYIPLNGYAAMQELDYCMRLEENGGEFIQTYKDGSQIHWNEAPVDMCHLISGTDIKSNVKKNSYDYAMKVVNEYLMDFLTQPNDDGFTLKSHLANFKSLIGGADVKKPIGANVGYCILGASCASVPMREINTYLATRVFEQFSQFRNHTPTEQDVAGIAENARVIELNSLLMELCANGGMPGFISTQIDWKEAKEFGDKNMVDGYEKQFAEKVGAQERNAKSMMSTDNEASLIARIMKELDACAKDLNKGPTYASRVIHASQSHNLLNIIDGLIESNKERWNHAQYQHDSHVYSDYEAARGEFNMARTGLLSGASGKYNAYVNAVENLMNCKTEIAMYSQMATVLDTLRNQLEEVSAKYYQVLARVMNNLIDTFVENDRALKTWDEKTNDDSSFTIPLVTISDLRRKLDKEIDDLDIPNLLNRFVGLFIGNSEAWLQEDEGSIAKVVTKFFVEEIFGGTNGFANKTITGFLEDKYDEKNPGALANHIYNEFMIPLAGKANAMFPFDESVWGEDRTDRLSSISVPETADSVKQAATTLFNNTNTFKVNSSALTDRIYLRSCVCALPMGSYKFCKQYEYDYFLNGKSAGRHYYEGNGGSELFNHWENMAPLTPVSLIESISQLPDAEKELLKGMIALYDKAVAFNMIVGNECRVLDDASRNEIRSAIETGSRELKRTDLRPDEKALRLGAISKSLNDQLVSLKYVTKYRLPEGLADAESAERIRKDYFVISPAIQNALKADINLVNELKSLIDDMGSSISESSASQLAIRDYGQAMFTGVITVTGLKVEFETTEFGMSKKAELSNFDPKYPYNRLAMYQGYLSYMQLSKEDQDKIKSETQKRIQDFSKEMLDTVKAFGSNLTDERNKNFAEAAKGYIDIYEDAMAFITQLNVDYRSLCGSLNI